MTRSLHSDLITELATDHLDQIHLISFQIGSTTYYRSTAYFDIVYDGNTYTAGGEILNLPVVTEIGKPTTANVNFRLSSVTQTFMTLFLTEEHIHRPVIVYRAYLNDAGALINNPFILFKGYIQGYRITETTTGSSIEVDVANHWANFEMRKGRRVNDNSQQKQFAGDKFFEFSNSLIVDLEWGKKLDEAD